MMTRARLPVRIAALVLGLLGLVAVFADVIASEAPLLARDSTGFRVLPGITHSSSRASGERAQSAEQGWAIWAPVRAGTAPSSATPEGAPPVRHFLGVDAQGRDVLAVTIHGARSVVLTTLGVLALALFFGVPLGAFAGRDNVADGLLSRLVELTGALPSLVLLAALHAGGITPSWGGVVLVLGALRAVEVARLVRGEVLRVSGTEFVLAARALGASGSGVVIRHVMPHVWGPVIVNAAFGATAVVSLEAALSFVGIGLPADVPSWGQLLGQFSGGGLSASVLAPVIGIVVTTASLYVVADALDDHVSARRQAPSRV